MGVYAEMNTQQKAQWLADFWASVALGEEWQFLDCRSVWTDYALASTVCGGPNMYSSPGKWRRKPEPIVRWTLRKNPCVTYDNEGQARHCWGLDADLVKLVEAG